MMFTLDRNTRILTDEADYEGIGVVADWVREDLARVFGGSDAPEKDRRIAVIAGSLEKSGLLAELEKAGKISADGLRDDSGNPRWEVYRTELAEHPLPDVDLALIIRGSDKRGTIYGLLSVSEAIGVTPFVNWSGAAPAKQTAVTLPDGFPGVSREPSVRYRGIFINDEWPAFGSWATKRFGGINAECYAVLFELLLRLRANYFWPAMWNSNFSMDGPGLKSAELADRLGIVMSTSHHEPCMRTGEEYRLLRGPGSIYGDAWDFLSNREGITRFWEDGLKRNAPFENVITMGMRGERDTAIMGNATLAENIALLKDIFRTQNDLIRKNVNPDLDSVPRQFVLFTEVEKFYYGDEQTPGLVEDPELDGVTVIFSDSNFGYTRTLPTAERRERKGGYGLYYHVDMHGGAHSYEWIGSTYLPRIRDQLRTAWDHGIHEIWVTNVGDLVSQELEVSLIMKMAWDIDTYGTDRADATVDFVREWTQRVFGGYLAKEDLDRIREVIAAYTLMNERCKHEIFNTKTYHPVHFGEAKALYENCEKVLSTCDALLKKVPDEIRTAFYELIYYPAVGTANLQKTWIASTWNRFYADQNRNTANAWNDVIDEGIRRDEALVEEFHALAEGKFYGHGFSEHFGFRHWNDSNNQLPTRTYVYPARKKRMLVSKTDEAWYQDGREYTVRERRIDSFLRPDCEEITLEISCASILPARFQITCEQPWLTADPKEGETDRTVTVTVRVDRSKLASDQITEGKLVIDDGEDCHVTLYLPVCGNTYYDRICRESDVEKAPAGAFVFACGHVAMEAGSFAECVDWKPYALHLLTPYGRTGQGLKLFPNTARLTEIPEEERPYAEYVFVSDEDRECSCDWVFAPSLPVDDSNSQCFAYQMNGEEPVTINTVLDPGRPVFNSPQWAVDNCRNAKRITAPLRIRRGINTLRYEQLDPNLILERIEIWDKAAEKMESCLGAPESCRLSADGKA